MDILYLLVPLSVVLVLAILAVFGWAVHADQFDDLDREGERIVAEPPPPEERFTASHGSPSQSCDGIV